MTATRTLNRLIGAARQRRAALSATRTLSNFQRMSGSGESSHLVLSFQSSNRYRSQVTS